ncbi:CDP-glycerol glycerophosphotransferase family protein [Flavobacterium sp. LB2P84]|uniref:CDP-glycerol glycerophosphotransferase family protein n=1 Tax=Flavobacterium yafengii TaxID=3041253 RepID=UPI0024A8B65E|nr:CDP-glycerol glycerophosphotransferase family protein [Flavobacterium yafengii]MDI6032850.1 CDP-glycerol glycerophosphotransferase family protein [Flavobacterium yafengii]
MRCILFCQNNYAFGILEPIKTYLENNGHDYIWYVNDKISADFPFKNEKNTSSISELENYKSDAIFVPGNEVPHYLRGLKVQIFHGLAGEKKGHFRIRHYFDLYLTQGPYFTERFNKLKSVYKDFDVIETGWPKLDIYGTDKSAFEQERKELLQKYNAKKILLYAPTFSPKLTSAPFLVEQIKSLSENKEYLILLKFHPLMDVSWIQIYTDLANEIPNIIFETEKNIIKFLLISDVLISDTSSVIYEFLLLDKPVITFNNISDNILWQNSSDYTELIPLVEKNLNEDPYSKERKFIFENYHPYNDGESAKRMVDAVADYIKKNGVPEKRKLSILRRFKINSIFKK